jgi:hypothetical protein
MQRLGAGRCRLTLSNKRSCKVKEHFFLVLTMLRQVAAAGCLIALSATGALAGEFRSGTYSDSGSSRTVRNVFSGTESVDSTRTFSNVITGSSKVDTVSFSATADNARLFKQHYGFATGDVSGQFGSAAAADVAVEGDTEFTGDLPSFLGALFGKDVEGTINTELAAGAAGGTITQGSLDIDGRVGRGREIGLDGSLDFSFQEGSQSISYGLNESGTTKYEMEQSYSETTVRDSETASGGSVFSFN